MPSVKVTRAMKKDKDNKKNLWYFNENINGDYYSPFTRSKRIYEYAGPGDREPTPKELTDYLDKYPDAYADSGGKTLERSIDTVSMKVGVELPCGVYRHEPKGDAIPERLCPIELRDDTVVPIHDFVDTVKKDIKNFLDNKDLYKEHGFFYKLGLLLYGAPGNSKTITIRQIIKESQTDNSVTIFLEGFPTSGFLNKIKDTLPGRLIIFVFEELTASTNSTQNINNLLNFLDGEMSIENSIIIATTNEPHALPANIVDRPSRFDKLYEFKNPNKAQRKLLLTNFLNRETTEEELINSKDLSIAALKEACLRSILNKEALLATLKQLQDRSALVKKAFCKPSKTGFGMSNDFPEWD